MTQKPDHGELKRAAEAVPAWARGTWEAGQDESTGAQEVRTCLDGDVDGDTGRHLVVGGDLAALIADALGDADIADFIALANPATVLALLAQIEALEGAAQAFVSMAHRSGPQSDRYWKACEALEAALKEASHGA